MNKVTLINDENPTATNFRIHQKESQFILKLLKKSRNFEVLEFEQLGYPELVVAFRPSSAVEVIDTTSDAAQCLNIVHKIRVGSVELGTEDMRANSVEELQYALSLASFVSYDSESIGYSDFLVDN